MKTYNQSISEKQIREFVGVQLSSKLNKSSKTDFLRKIQKHQKS